MQYTEQRCSSTEVYSFTENNNDRFGLRPLIVGLPQPAPSDSVACLFCSVSPYLGPPLNFIKHEKAKATQCLNLHIGYKPAHKGLQQCEEQMKQSNNSS